MLKERYEGKTLVQHEYIGDESIRNINNKSISVVNNYMAVLGDSKYLIATYKHLLSVFNSKECILEYAIADGRMVEYLGTPFGLIKIKKLNSKYLTAVASFKYKNNNYEILFGYGVDDKKFLFSRHAKRWFDARTLRKIRRWFSN